MDLVAEPVDLHYAEIAARYRDRLWTQLRQFRAGDEFLDLWVYDDDTTKSLLNLFDAAAAAGVLHLSVDVEGEALARLDPHALQGESAGFATLDLRRRGEALHIQVTLAPGAIPGRPVMSSNLRVRSRPSLPVAADAASPNASASPDQRVLYQGAAARQVALGTPHRGALQESDGLALATADEDGWRLYLLIDPQTRTIRNAAWEGGQDELSQASLELACATIVGRPVGDARGHGAIRVESALRDPATTHTITGVVTPANAHPTFARLERLLRAAAHAYSPDLERASTFAPEPHPSWASLTEGDKMRLVQEVLDLATKANALPPAECLRIRKDRLVCLTIDQRGAQGGHTLMLLERCLQEQLEPTLVCELEPRRDKSPIRRL